MADETKSLLPIDGSDQSLRTLALAIKRVKKDK